MTRTGYRSAEPTIGIDVEGTVFLYPAIGGGERGVARSTDAGASWGRVVPALQGQPTHRTSLDPYMYLDPRTGRVFADDLTTPNCSVLSWTDDGGGSWDRSVAGCMEFDHQTIFAGPPTTSQTASYPNVVYRCAINLVAAAGASTASTCQRSLDGGRTWLPPGEPAFLADPREEGYGQVPGYCDGATGHGFVDRDGTVYLPRGWCGQPWLAISEDEGLTWTRVQVAGNGMPMTSDGYAQGHEAGVGVDPAGNVYYFWVARDRLPYLAVSRDGGATWSEPMMVGPPDLTEAALPQLIVGGTGKLAFAYVGSTNAPGGPIPPRDCVEDPDPNGCVFAGEGRDYSNATWNGYIGTTVDALADRPTFHTAPVNSPADPLVVGECGPIRCQEVFDFIDVRIGPDGTPWAPFVDGCTEGACQPDDTGLGEGVVGRLWGGPSLWDAEDPNGRYPGP